MQCIVKQLCGGNEFLSSYLIAIKEGNVLINNAQQNTFYFMVILHQMPR